MKSLLFSNKPDSVQALEVNIERVIHEVRPDLVEKVLDWVHRIHSYKRSRGSLLNDVIFRTELYRLLFTLNKKHLHFLNNECVFFFFCNHITHIGNPLYPSQKNKIKNALALPPRTRRSAGAILAGSSYCILRQTRPNDVLPEGCAKCQEIVRHLLSSVRRFEVSSRRQNHQRPLCQME